MNVARILYQQLVVDRRRHFIDQRLALEVRRWILYAYAIVIISKWRLPSAWSVLLPAIIDRSLASCTWLQCVFSYLSDNLTCPQI